MSNSCCKRSAPCRPGLRSRGSRRRRRSPRRRPDNAEMISATSGSRRSRPSSGRCPRCDRRSRKSPRASLRIRSPVRNHASPRDEHVAQDLALGGLFVGIALEAPAASAPLVGDLADRPRPLRPSRSARRSLPRCAPARPRRRRICTSATGKRCARNDGIRPIAPGLPSQL